MSEWHGPRKCEECGAATCDKAWVGEFEYENGICRHFTKRGDRNGVIPLLCSGKMHPYDRRAQDPEKQDYKDALQKLRPECNRIADAVLRRYEEEKGAEE